MLDAEKMAHELALSTEPMILAALAVAYKAGQISRTSNDERRRLDLEQLNELAQKYRIARESL